MDWSPHIAQARVRLAIDTLPQTPHRVGALCTGYPPPYCYGLVLFLPWSLFCSMSQVSSGSGILFIILNFFGVDMFLSALCF